MTGGPLAMAPAGCSAVAEVEVAVGGGAVVGTKCLSWCVRVPTAYPHPAAVEFGSTVRSAFEIDVALHPSGG